MFTPRQETPKPVQRPAEARPQPTQAKKPMPEAFAKTKASGQETVISSDMSIVGNVNTPGGVKVSGTIEGDIRAHHLTINEGATVKGEVVADDVVVEGFISGCIRGLRVRLTSTARVEGDIIHQTIAIESGANFEGAVRRKDNPLEKKPADMAA